MAIPRQRVYLSPKNWLEATAFLFGGRLIEGEKIAAFEDKFAQIMGSRYAIAVPSGRAGLRYILQGLEIEPGAEIIVPAYTYPIVPFVIKAMGYEVRFVDIDLPNLGMNPRQFEQAITNKTRAVIATHLFGVPCNMEKIVPIAEKAGVQVIEDCAHCLDASIGGRKAGTFGRISYFSFETSKCVNTLGGGMLITSDVTLAQRIRTLEGQGQKAKISKIFKRLAKTSFEALVTFPPFFTLFVYPALRAASLIKGGKDVIGEGYVGSDITMDGRTDRYTNFQAHLGLKGLEAAVKAGAKRIRNAKTIAALLDGKVVHQTPVASRGAQDWLLFSVLVKDMEQVSARLLKRGVDSKRYYMRDCAALYCDGAPFINAALAERQVLHLPAFPELTEADMKRVTRNLLESLT